MVGQYVVVGAPMRSIANTSTPAGAAYVFSYSPNDGAWQQIGLAMRSMEGILEANGDFGASVALGLSTSQRVVIGAPKSSSAVDALQGGRVYSFESSGSEWNSLEASPIYGKNAYDWFGASVDMSKDGSRFIVGAPGNMSDSPGYFRTYVWMDTQWIQEYEGTGVSGEYFGSSVVVLSDEGDLFAVGGPGFSEGSGRVVVYQRQSSGEYLQLGEPLVGLQGERFGSGGSLSGGPFTTGTVVVVGTNTGVVKSFVFDSTAGTWNEQFEALSTSNDSGTGVSVEYSEADGLLVGTSASDMVSLYTTGTTAAPASPTSTPTASTIGTTTAPVSTNTSSVPTTTAPTVSTNTSSVPASGTPVTVAPTVTSLVGTAPPTINAAVPLANWTLTATEFTPQTENSGFGASVSLSSSSMVVGAPQTLGNGGVFIYQKVSGIWETAASGQLFGTEPGGLFGSSVDVVDGFLVVGAPSTVANGTTISVGAAFCYAQINGKWDPLGRTLIGDSGVFGTQEQFGASVSAASATRRVVVGAPGSSLDSIVTRGRVYVFEFTEASSSWTRMFDVSGTTASFALGTSVDMAQDGSQFVVGAPGGGYAEIYEYSGTTWVSAHIVQDTIGGFGSAVAILASNTFAVGAPEANGGQGRVVVYQLNNAGIFAALGTPIEGSTGDRLGATGTVSGSDSATTIVLGTANGSVRRLGYDADTDSWVEISVSVSTEFGTGLRAVSASSQGSVFVVGGTLDAAIYELL